MRLEPRFQIPDDPKEAIKALSERLRVLEDLVQKTTVAQTKLVTAEPAKPRDGLFAYADGDNWDPGAGRGLYQYVNATWQPVSAPRPEIPVQIPQTPWAQDVDAAGFNLTNLAALYGASATNILKFFVSGAEAARFDANGSLGIGAPSAAVNYRLQVQGGRTVLKPADEAYALGLCYSAVVFGMWLGADASGNLIISDAGGTARLKLTTSGTLYLLNCPTSSAGLSSGALWVDTTAGRVVKQVA